MPDGVYSEQETGFLQFTLFEVYRSHLPFFSGRDLTIASIGLSVFGLGSVSKLLNFQKTFQQLLIATGLVLSGGLLRDSTVLYSTGYFATTVA